MAIRREKAHDARVRASRARSRVVARRRSRAESARRESLEKISATYARARERLNSYAARAADSEPPLQKKKEAERDGWRKETRRERTRSRRPDPPAGVVKVDKDVRPQKNGRGRMRKQALKQTAVAEISPAPVAGGEEREKTRKRKKDGAAEDRRTRREKKTGDGRNTSRQPDGGEPTAGEKVKEQRGLTRNARIAILGSLLVISLGALLWVYTGTGVLNVKTVEVKGNERLDSAYLCALSGITQQSHLLKMDVGAVESALLSEPYVAAVDISRVFPNTVVLEITERQPAAFILQNGMYSLVDEEGVILESTADRPQGLVEIKDLDLPLLLPGSVIEDADFTMVNSLLASLPLPLQEMAAEAGYIDGEGLYIRSGDTSVIYGDASELTYKNTVALLSLTNLVGRYGDVEYIDVSFPDRPVIKPR